MTSRLLLPLLNRNVATFSGPTWYLSEKLCVETISSEDFGLVLSFAPDEYKSLLSSKSKCIRIELADEKSWEETCIKEATKTAFLLNFFKKSQPIALAFAVHITKKRRTRFDQIIDLPVVADLQFQRKHNYHVRDKIAREDMSQFYQIISHVVEKQPTALITLDRFNAALSRVSLYDRIIDISICLESLVNGTTDLKHKFALYNAWAAESNKTKRQVAYRTLMKLYDARSQIVHGTKIPNKTTDQVLQQWPSIVGIAEKAVGYHLLYLYGGRIEDWHQHQNCLALGIEKRIIEENSREV